MRRSIVHFVRRSVTALLVLFACTNIQVSLKPIEQALDIDKASFTLPEVEHQETNTTSRLQLTPLCTDESTSCNLPRWMKDYFLWHREQLKSIRQPTDWLQQRIFVLRCMDDDICGGTADRLRPLPFFLAMAARSKRLIFIRWNRPIRLEAIMEPYQLNWVVPDSLAHFLDNKNGTASRSRKLNRIAKESMNPDLWLLEGFSQAMTYGDIYDTMVADLEPTSPRANPREYFHDMFLALFRPVPSLQLIIDRMMEELGLHPNQFVATHIRSLYPGHPYEKSLDVRDLRPTVLHAVECASSTLAGAPVFVAADTAAAKEVAHQYGSTNTVFPVVSDFDLDNSTRFAPVHLEFDQKEDPSAFFGIFLDLFIMSQSRCVAFGVGGFGRFGSYTSFNASCKAQYDKPHKGRLIECAVHNVKNGRSR